MDKEIFEIETGLNANEYREVFRQWQIKRSVAHLHEAFSKVQEILDRFLQYNLEELKRHNTPEET
ncbi:MAG: hypothetical protein EOP51_08085 [Sphingobacteriales bacterium]|nr:MAG: hypothetical protein EOP51_08085 [Sphingobacteriales bacterium]